MNLSSVLLALWVFLVSSVSYLAWFEVDAKLIGWIGVIFVIVWVVESLRGPVVIFKRDS